MPWKDLVVPADSATLLTILEEWRWLVGDGVRALWVTRAGDALVLAEDGGILRLDPSAAELTALARNQEALADDEKANEWLRASFVEGFLATGAQLEDGECIGYKLPPMLGGSYEIDNLEATELRLHFSLLGQIAMQSRELPEGTAIADFETKR